MTFFIFLDTDSILIDKVWAKTTYSAFWLFCMIYDFSENGFRCRRISSSTSRQVDNSWGGTKRQHTKCFIQKIKVAPIHEGPNSKSPVRAFMSRARLPILIKTACEKKGRMKRYQLCKQPQSDGIPHRPGSRGTAYMTYNVSR